MLWFISWSRMKAVVAGISKNDVRNNMASRVSRVYSGPSFPLYLTELNQLMSRV